MNNSNGRTLSKPIGHAPVFGDLPRLNLGLLAVPIPRVTEPAMRHAMRDPLDLGVVPAPATVGGHFHLLDGSATGPGQAANLVESAARQLVSAGRESDDRFGPDLVFQRSDFRLVIHMPE